MTTSAATRAGWNRPVIVIVTVIVATVVNSTVYAIGRLVGGDFRFTSGGVALEVDPLTLIGFTALPLAIGMTAAALLSRWPWTTTAALVIGPVLAVGSIAGMTLPADFDIASKLALSLCHVALVPAMVAGLLALRRRG